jgi:hypothetical protein
VFLPTAGFFLSDLRFMQVLYNMLCVSSFILLILIEQMFFLMEQQINILQNIFKSFRSEGLNID